MLNNAYSALDLEREKDSPTLSYSRIQRLYLRGSQEIREALHPYGYYNATVTPSYRYDRNENVIFIQYDVDPGPPIYIQSLDIKLEGEAADDPTMQRFFNTRPFTEGQQLNQIEYDRFKAQLLELAIERGYFDADFSQHTITINTQSNTANLVLYFISGQRYQFGEIIFEPSKFDESFLRRFIGFSPGDPYLSSTLLDTQRALSNNNYFTSVEVAPLFDKKEGQAIPIYITVTPRKPISLGLGAGYGTDTGIRARFDSQWYRMTDTGHQLQNLLRVSQYQQSFESRYIIPGPDPRTDQYALSAIYVDDQPQNNVIQSRTLQLSGSYLTGDPVNEWSRIISINAQTERFDDVNNINQSHLIYPVITFERIMTDDRFNPKHGLSLRFDSKGAVQPLSTTNFLQFEGQSKYIHSFNQNQRLLARTHLGYTLRDDINNIPPSLRFFAGGDNSVRGYAFETLGPTEVDSSGDLIVVGGAYLVVGSLELEQRIKGNWAVAAFYDVGNAFDSFNEFRVEQGIGLGLRWRSPVGPIRLDIAHPLSNEPRFSRLFRIHFTLGPDL